MLQCQGEVTGRGPVRDDTLFEAGREGRGAGTPSTVWVVVDRGEDKVGHDDGFNVDTVN